MNGELFPILRSISQYIDIISQLVSHFGPIDILDNLGKISYNIIRCFLFGYLPADRHQHQPRFTYRSCSGALPMAMLNSLSNGKLNYHLYFERSFSTGLYSTGLSQVRYFNHEQSE